MADLIVRIDRTLRTARFSGRGTFWAKEEIKRIGPARWLHGEKAWELRDFDLDNETLLALFPGLEIEESGEGCSGPPVSPPPTIDPNLPKGVSVSELSYRVRSLLAQAFPGTIYVYGVLSSVKRVSARVFMDLADAERPDEYLSCVIWADEEEICRSLTKVGLKLERDLQVMFEARVDLSRKDGRLSLRIVSVVAEYSVAKLAAMRELTNKRLQAEGLFDRNKRLALSFLPVRLGILTSAGGTVINDFRASLDEVCFGFELFWLQVNVQGAGAKDQIARGLQLLNSYPGLDAVLLFRGGGSPAELSVFNEYEVAKAICLSRIPVISAIGHEADQSSAQDVSYRCCGVPKDIGRFFADIVRDLRARFAEHARVVHECSDRMIIDSEKRLSYFASFLSHAMDRMVHYNSEMLYRMSSALPHLGIAIAASESRRLEQTSRPLSGLSSRIAVQAARDAAASARQIALQAGSRLAAAQSAAARAAERLSHAAEQLVREASHRFSSMRRLDYELGALIEKRSAAVEEFNTLVREASPETQLGRGFTLVKRPGSEGYVTIGAELEPGEHIDIEFRDTKRSAIVE